MVPSRNSDTFRRLGRTHLIAPVLLLLALLGRIEWAEAIPMAAGLYVGTWLGGIVVDAVERTPLAFLSFLLGVATFIVGTFAGGILTAALLTLLF